MLDIEKLEEQLFEMQDLKYRDFHSKLLPGTDKDLPKNLQRHRRQKNFCRSFHTDIMKKITCI